MLTILTWPEGDAGLFTFNMVWPLSEINSQTLCPSEFSLLGTHRENTLEMGIAVLI